MKTVYATARWLWLLLALVAAACGNDKASPEARVRALIAEAEQAAEGKQLGALKDMLTDDYQDNQGLDKRAAVRLLQVYFLRNESIYLLTRVRNIVFPQSDQAEVGVAVAMAGTPIGDDLGGVRADLHYFQLEMINQGGAWRVRRADWRQASLEDFL